MSDDFQSEFATLAPSGASKDESFEAAFDHRHDRFNLNAIAIRGAVEVGYVTMFGRLRHWLRRDRQLECFIELLRKSEICTEKQATDLVSSFGNERGEITSGDDGVSQFCRFLIVKNAVTEWQCDKLKAGKFRGVHLDDYLLLEVVGQDNTSRSYRARDMRDGSIVRLIVTPMNRTKERHIEYRVERNFE